jgi:hypothetical protein
VAANAGEVAAKNRRLKAPTERVAAKNPAAEVTSEPAEAKSARAEGTADGTSEPVEAKSAARQVEESKWHRQCHRERPVSRRPTDRLVRTAAGVPADDAKWE